jgi:phage gp16-like protein
MSRKGDLAKIHIAKKQLCLDEYTYREMLLNHGGHRSSAKMTGIERAAVLRHLARAGFSAKKRAYQGRPANMNHPEKGKMLGKIEALLAEANRTWEYAHGMAKRMFHVDQVQWLTPRQLHKLIAALMADAKRHGRRTG